MTVRIIAFAIVAVGLLAVSWVAFAGDSDEASQATSVDAASTSATAAPATDTPATPTAVASSVEPQNYGPRMDLVDIDRWLQTDSTSIDDFDGTVLLVEMWTFGCFNCKARIPFNQSYADEFADENFQILGVHAPEFSYEADFDNIADALDRLGVHWPQALDTNKANFRAWQPGTTSYWPRTYVVDQNGDVRYDHIGEGGYEQLRQTIRFLLDHPPESRT